MNSIVIAELEGSGGDEIERLYDELDVSECECARPRRSSCDFHQKLIRLQDLQKQEIEVIERGFRQLRSSITKTLPLLEEIDAGFNDVLK